MSATTIYMMIAFGGLILSIFIFDIWVIKKKGPQESISAYLIRGFRKFPIVNFLVGLAFGILVGHLFWSMDTHRWMYPEQFREICVEFMGGNDGV